MPEFDERQTAAVLAGLRLLQRDSIHMPRELRDIYDNGGTLKPLSNTEIDGLCEAVNCGPEEKPQPHAWGPPPLPEHEWIEYPKLWEWARNGSHAAVVWQLNRRPPAHTAYFIVQGSHDRALKVVDCNIICNVMLRELLKYPPAGGEEGGADDVAAGP